MKKDCRELDFNKGYYDYQTDAPEAWPWGIYILLCNI